MYLFSCYFISTGYMDLLASTMKFIQNYGVTLKQPLFGGCQKARLSIISHFLLLPCINLHSQAFTCSGYTLHFLFQEKKYKYIFFKSGWLPPCEAIVHYRFILKGLCNIERKYYKAYVNSFVDFSVQFRSRFVA